MSWWLIFLPAVAIASIVSLDNKYVGPYFALADAVFNEYHAEVRWTNRQVVGKLFRRACYLFLSGLALSICGYRPIEILGVAFIAAFLLIWPAFFRSLPRYARVADWEVISLWVFFVLSCVMFGLLGASTAAIVQLLTGKPTTELLRDHILTALITFPFGVIFTASWFPLQQRLERRESERGQFWLQ